jgi:hypothetical protein
VRKKITFDPKTRKRAFACAAAILVVLTALTLFSGCVEEGESRQLDLGEPVKEVNPIVGKEGFNVDVEGNIFGEQGLYYLVEQETGVKSPIMEFEPCARVVEETYLGKDGAEIVKYKIGKKRFDKQQIEKSGVNIDDLYLPEDKIRLMIKKLPDGTYDLSDLTKSTEALGWEHISLPGYFPGSDKNPKANDNIIGNNGRKPELREELTPTADSERLNDITFFNTAYLDEYKELASYVVLSDEDFPEKEVLFWRSKAGLKKPIKIYKELFGGDLCYTISTIYPTCTDTLITGSPDYKYGTAIQKAE